jgi:Polyketide cyclase / dehydrase and lipid transport
MANIIHAEASANIDAPAEIVYNILADYQVGHPAILPKAYFTGLSVEQGGRGAGTVIVTRMQAMGSERTFRMTATEPQPGRILVESDGVTTTTFTVEPISAKKCRVTITTEVPPSQGFQGWIERLFTPPFLRRVYHLELVNLMERAGASEPETEA